MVRRGLSVIVLAACASVAQAATTYNINFKNLTGTFNGTTLNSSSTPSSGTNTITDTQLTITAGIMPGGAADPFANTLTSQNVFWGNLGNVGGSTSACGLLPNCRGLGVGSNSPMDDNEALVLNFGGSQVQSSSISFTLRGYNSGNQAYLFVDFKPLGSPANVSILTPLTVGNADLQLFRFQDIALLNVSTNVARFAIVDNNGVFGVGDLNYTVDTVAPEPSTYVMMLTGLIAIVAVQKRRKARP